MRAAAAEIWRIRGRVQGVGFRDWMVREAERAGVTGWVRNRADGDVEAGVQGAPAALAALHERCRRGPAAASVSSIERTESEPFDVASFRRRADG